MEDITLGTGNHDSYIVCPVCDKRTCNDLIEDFVKQIHYNRHIQSETSTHHQLKCDECKEVFWLDEREIKIGAFGCAYQHCPACSEQVFIEDLELDKKYGLDLTSKNIVFPDHFYHSTKGVPISDEKVTKWIRECVKACELNDQEWGVFALQESGDTLVIAMKYEDEYRVNVCKHPYEVCIYR